MLMMMMSHVWVTECACNSYGQHLSTYDVTTGAITYKFAYNVNSYYGRLVRATDVTTGSSVIIRRDYRLLAHQLVAMTTAGARRRLGQSQRQQRCHVTTDSNGLLASLTTPSSVTTRFSYVRDTGLLRSRQTGNASNDGYTYQYSGDGRVTSLLYNTGRQCTFASVVDGNWVDVNSSCDGSRVLLTQSNHSLNIYCSQFY